VLVRVSTELALSPDLTFETVKKPDTLAYITRGLLGFRPLNEIPADWGEGLVVRIRLYFFHVVPAWRHEIEIVRLDEAARVIETQERGGPVRNWNHRISVAPSANGTRYSDEIEIRAGPLTPLVWLYAQLFYRYRQHRWRKLARTLRAPVIRG
jgi:ligand-binding SRPBCC domain-containing protein